MALKSFQDIINEELPNLKVSSLEVGDRTLYYDAYASEDDVQKLAELLKRLKVDVKLEQRVF